MFKELNEVEMQDIDGGGWGAVAIAVIVIVGISLVSCSNSCDK